MANDIIKLTTKHRINEINRNNPRPVVTDWNDANLRRLNVVDGDTVLLSHWATIEYQDGTVDDLVMTGATALRAIIRADLTGTGVIIGTQSSYNQTGDATIEDLANGKVTWLLTVGEISYAITSVDAGTNTLTIQGDYTAQFAATNACRISGSTGNDGDTYTISGTPTYSASTNLTTIVLNDPDGDFTDATADGNFIHSAVQNLTFNSQGVVTAYVEYEYTDASSRVQTILPSFECRLIVQQNTGNVGNPAGSSLTYLTSAEIAATYGTQAMFYTFSTTTTAADPGAGVLRFDNATPASVTGIYVDDSPANISNLDFGALWAAGTGKQILIVQRDTPANFLYADIDSVADGTGYWDLTVTVLDSGVLPDNSANLSVFIWQGSATGDVVGPGSSTDNAVARFNGTTGKLLQDSAILITDVGQLRLIKATDEASATTTDLSALEGNFAHVTGTTTITGMGTVAAGTQIEITFDGILTLTHNATSLILPTGANITTAANDCARFVSEGSGNWRCLNYQRADGTALATSGGISDGDTLSTGLTFPNTGLHILDTNASHDLIIAPGSDLTADRTLTLTTGDADRAVTLGRDVDLSDGGTFADFLSEKQSLVFTFSTTTTASDPGAGVLRFDNATPASVTGIYIDDSPANISGLDLSTAYADLATHRILILQKNDTAKFLLGEITAVADGTGYYDLTVTTEDSGTLPDNGAELLVAILPGPGGGGGSAPTTIEIKANELTPDSSSGPSIGTVTLSSAEEGDVLIYPGGSNTGAYWVGGLPDGWDAGTITAKFYWRGTTGCSVSDDVDWNIAARSYADDEDMGTAPSATGQTVTDVITAADGTDLQISAATSAVTVAGSPSAADLVIFKFSRLGVADTMTEDAWLIKVIITFSNA